MSFSLAICDFEKVNLSVKAEFQTFSEANFSTMMLYISFSLIENKWKGERPQPVFVRSPFIH